MKLMRHTDLMLGAGLLVVVGMLILPLPHWVLDSGLVVAIATSVIIFLSAVNVDDPVKFSVFPSLLLITTLFRVALSIAATKLILGTGQAGGVIATFGSLVMGGDFVVGFVAFLILMIIQFIVITNGAGRVSEVVARFTLDAMPGKQMSIDADLAAGLIDEAKAKERRKAVKQEADFYGAMDGASKFVKGDAVAALMIIGINILGGFAVGFMRGEGDAMTILKTYALLSVGEGLVSQIPALLISTASGLLVTRAGQDTGMGGALFEQFLGQPKSILSASAALAAFAFVPGFPATIFLALAGGLFATYKMIKTPGFAKSLDKALGRDVPAEKVETAPTPAPTGPEAVLPLLNVDPLEIEIGHGLTRLADPRAGGDLPERVSATRREVALELGFIMPSVRIRDNVALESHEYRLKVRGEEVGKGRVEMGLVLALNSGGALYPLNGIPYKEPVFGLEGVWIDPGQREEASQGGYTIIEPNVMITTHLSEVVKAHAADLLTRQDVNTLLDHAKQANQAVVSELVPGQVKIGDVQKVLQHLLRERVPIRDMVTILETMADFSERVKDNDSLGELVRASIARTITRQHMDADGRMYCMALEPLLEDELNKALQNTTMGNVLIMDPKQRESLLRKLRADFDRAMVDGKHPVLLSGNVLRLPLRRLIEHDLPNLHVMAYNEVSANADVDILGAVSLEVAA